MSAEAECPSSPRFALLTGALVVGTLVGAALIAPAAATLLEVLRPASAPPFSRVYDRVAIAVLLVALIVLRRRLGLGRIAESWREESWPERGRRAAAGLAASLVPALLVLSPAIDSSQLLWAGRTALQAAEKMAAAIPSALVIGLVEESFFRVVVFRGLAATWRWPVAAVASSALYSLVHFLTPQKGFEIIGASPLEGLRYLGAVVGRLADPNTLPAVLGLFLIGLVLCVALQWQRSLALVIGLHAGWLLAAKAAIRLTSLPPELADGGSLVKRQLLIGSPWLWLAVAVSALLVVVAVRPDRAASTPSRP
ncbi:MAG TPA: CPBP family intramembrane glutamic endopeptidase [Candidatus Sulfomarinibacteraceae bacterium]|nr:CPBP family intramembrane glutamic endopeptidase [Candidatus Sulfomarinibacteraceae bacterium]